MGIRDTLASVASQMKKQGLSHREAALEIGVTEESLRRHLAREYVRSDSLAKYRAWLNGITPPRRSIRSQLELLSSQQNSDTVLMGPEIPEPTPPLNRHRVVDLFSGCGGLSLGFDLWGGGAYFETVLAIDVEAAMVETFNRNHPRAGEAIAQQVDLGDFLAETEVRAFYLRHVAVIEEDSALAGLLEEIRPIGLLSVVEAIRRLDAHFLTRLMELRNGSDFTNAYSSLDSRVLGQTSVVGFHQALGLPEFSTRAPDLRPLIWAGPPDTPGRPEDELNGVFVEEWLQTTRLVRSALNGKWEEQIEQLVRRGDGNGRGQLVSSARRIRAFVEFLKRIPAVRTAWLDWRSRRDALRLTYFENQSVSAAFAMAYSADRRVSVVLGGPPCQGFSRVGRGKIRSLREERVQVHYDAVSGDLRNRLFEKYVLFVEALAPDVFLFENVRHFQTEVRAPDGTYRATEILAEAVRNLSRDGLEYDVDSRTVLASDHAIPQARERFFMVGVRKNGVADPTSCKLPAWVLSLPVTGEVPLHIALADLPEPFLVDSSDGGSLDRTFREEVAVAPEASNAADKYRAWVRQPPAHRPEVRSIEVDSHVGRDHRADDRAWFALMAPGKRWMDYRCDNSGTLHALQSAFDHAIATFSALAKRHRAERSIVDELKRARGMLDGSLSLRLLLETLELLPGELQHHLATDTYLKKREGNHGDWLARLDPTKPGRTVMTHMGKDTYAYIHPWRAGSLSVREAARVQSFPDWFSFAHLGLVDGFRVIGNAVPPLLSAQFAGRVAGVLAMKAEAHDAEPREVHAV